MKSSTNILKMSSELKIKSLVLTNGLYSYVKISVSQRDFASDTYFRKEAKSLNYKQIISLN